MKSAFLKDDALLQDILSVESQTDQFNLWWLGQSGFLVHYLGAYFLFDPYLSDSLSKKYELTDKPHTRMTERVIDPARLTMISHVTSSHNHTDHLDAETLISLAHANPKLSLILPAPNVEFAKARLLGAEMTFVPLDEHSIVEMDQWTLHGVTAAHNDVVRNERGQSLYLGFVLKFGPFAIYHSGDTLWHDTLVQELIGHKIDVALVPINGNKPERRVAGNLNPSEAACLSKAIGARLAVPHHYDMFEFNTADPAEFADACQSVRQPYRILRNGERMDFAAA